VRRPQRQFLLRATHDVWSFGLRMGHANAQKSALTVKLSGGATTLPAQQFMDTMC
jgi:hypothetical protein